MSYHTVHPHAEFDRFPQLAAEFGSDIDRIINAELADFVWESRFAERDLGAWEGFDDDDESSEIVRIIGYFRGRYIVATCIVDGNRHVQMMLKQRQFDNVGDAELATLAKRMERFPNLRALGLMGPKVTDAGLAHLKGLKQLTNVYLFDTRVTEQGKTDLRRALPKLREL